MKQEDVKIGMKVVPHDKTALHPYSFSQWMVREGSQPFREKGFCIVTKGPDGMKEFCLDSGMYFNASDFEPYAEHNKQKFGGYFEGNKTVFYLGKDKGEADYNPKDEKECLPYSAPYGLLLAYCRATNTDIAIADMLFKKPEDKLRDEVAELIRSSGTTVQAIRYYREKMSNCSLMEAKRYVEKVKAEIRPVSYSVIIDGVKYVKEENERK